MRAHTHTHTPISTLDLNKNRWLLWNSTCCRKMKLFKSVVWILWQMALEYLKCTVWHSKTSKPSTANYLPPPLRTWRKDFCCSTKIVATTSQNSDVVDSDSDVVDSDDSGRRMAYQNHLICSAVQFSPLLPAAHQELSRHWLDLFYFGVFWWGGFPFC